jgi:hypothetical protein
MAISADITIVGNYLVVTNDTVYPTDNAYKKVYHGDYDTVIFSKNGTEELVTNDTFTAGFFNFPITGDGIYRIKIVSVPELILVANDAQALYNDGDVFGYAGKYYQVIITDGMGGTVSFNSLFTNAIDNGNNIAIYKAVEISIDDIPDEFVIDYLYINITHAKEILCSMVQKNNKKIVCGDNEIFGEDGNLKPVYKALEIVGVLDAITEDEDTFESGTDNVQNLFNYLTTITCSQSNV